MTRRIPPARVELKRVYEPPGRMPRSWKHSRPRPRRTVTLVYAARDEAHNDAVALSDILLKG